MPKKTIREVTEITGITEGALRYYNDKGVIHPSEKSIHGRREWLYDETAIAQLRKLVLYKKMGLPIEVIRRLLNEVADDGAEIEKILREHLLRLKDELELMVDQIALTELEIKKVRGDYEEN